jgi:hypothetical protein
MVPKLRTVSLSAVPLRTILKGFVVAFAAAVAVGVLGSVGYGVARILVSPGGSMTDEVGGLVFIAVMAAYLSAKLAVPTIVFGGVPFVLLSFRLRWGSLHSYVVWGAILGIGTFAVMTAWKYLYPMPSFHMDSDTYFTAISTTSAGAVAAFAFWSVVRPDHRLRQ